MTDIEMFNVIWITHAMSVPSSSTERYYYDGDTHKLFYVYTPPSGIEQIIIYNSVGLSLSELEFKEIMAKLGTIDTTGSQIIEVPRFAIKDKVTIQLLFMARYSLDKYYNDFYPIISLQEDQHGFALDILLSSNEDYHLIAVLWEDFKGKRVLQYITKFANALGVQLVINEFLSLISKT